MKKFLISVLVLLTFSIKVFSLNSIIEVSASDTTDISHPGEYAIDGDSSRGWELDKEESQGWISLTLDNPLVINGLRFSGYLSEYTRYNIGYKDESGIIRDFFSGLDRVILEEQLIDLSFDRVIADNLYIRIIENSNVRSSITNIEILGEDPTLGLKKKAVEEIVATENTSPYSIEDNLVDGKSGTFWRVEKDLKWSKVHWAVKDFLDNIVKTKKEKHEKHEKEKKGKKDKKDKHNKTNDYEGFVEFTLNKEVSKIRFYVPEGDKGIYSIEGESNEGTKSLANFMPLDEGWLETTFDPLVFTTIKLVIESYDKKDFPKIGEVEFWGENDYQIENKEYLSPYYQPGPYEADNNNYFEWSRKDETPILELVVDKSSEESIVLNGEIINSLEVLILDSNKVLTFRPEDTQLFDGYNFINKEGVLGVRLRNDLKIGSYFSSEDVLTDSILLTVNPDNDGIVVLDKDVFIERVELYSVNGVSPVLYVFNNEEWEEIYSIERKDNRIIYSGGLTTNLLKVAYGEDIISEIKIFGSYIDNKKPEIEILYPYDGLEMISHLPGYSVFIGRVNDPEAEITINGKTAKKYGNIFWIEMKKLKLPKSGFFPIEVVATGTTGLITKKDIEILIQHNGYRDSVDGEDLIFTSDDAILIEGTSNQWRSKLYINDVEYSINGMKFSHELPLEPGLNQFKIDFRDKKGKIVKLFYKRVFRETSNLTLVLSNSYNDILTRKNEITINGFVKGFGEVTVDVNGIKAAVNGFSFLSGEIALSEGVNTITVNAIDELGNNQSRIINVIKDTIAPTVSEVLPLGDTIISFREVNMEGFVTEDLGTRVFVNGNIATLSEDLSFMKELIFPDGINPVYIYTVDKAGNKSETFTTQVVTDTTPPNDFDVFADPNVWTNNISPEMTFTTTDLTTSIAYYEAKVDAGGWSTIVSPYIIPAQEDETHTVYIRATDDAGHSTTSSTQVFIDTTLPEDSEVFRTIPNRDSVDLIWVPSVSEDTIEYRMIRTPNWVSGDKIFGKEVAEYRDIDVEISGEYVYELYTIDRAYNSSLGLVSDNNIIGLEVEEYDDTNGSIAEYENLSLIIPGESLPEDVIEIHITEVLSPALVEAASNILIGPIYNTSVVREINGERVTQEHIAFEKDFLASLTYEEENFPDGFPEENIGVYYFDSMWGEWFLVKDSAVDKENNKILFKTNHFTSFSLQPVMTPQLSPQEYRSMGVSPFNSGHSNVNVDPQSGSVSLSVEEFNLPGRAGFDFSLKRIYSSTRARKDSFNMALAKSLGYTFNPNTDIDDDDIINKLIQLGVNNDYPASAAMIINLMNQYKNNGDYAYSMGAGWRLDLPSINKTKSQMSITIPGGANYGVNQMDLMYVEVDETREAVRELRFDNHEGADFTLIIKQTKEEIAQTVTSRNYSIDSWSMYEAILFLKNGKSYYFDMLGRITRIVDPLGETTDKNGISTTNEIIFTYNEDKLFTIEDSMGRIIVFDYNEYITESTPSLPGIIAGRKDNFVPILEKITVKDFKGEEKTIDYTIDNSGYLGLLIKATDLEGREWLYGYEGKTLSNDTSSIAVDKNKLLANYLNSGGLINIAGETIDGTTLNLSNSVQAEWVDCLKSVSGPGIGITNIDYRSESMVFESTVNEETGELYTKDDYNGLYPTEDSFRYSMIEKLLVDETRVSIVEEASLASTDAVKTTAYEYNFKYVRDSEFVNYKTIVNNGKTLVAHQYKEYQRYRYRRFNLNDENMPYLEYIDEMDSIPKKSKVETRDMDENLLFTIYTDYDDNTLKLNYTNKLQGDNYAITHYKYDGWGNIVHNDKYSTTNGVQTHHETWTDYFASPNSYKYEESTLSFESWELDDDGTGYKHNLIKSIIKKNYNSRAVNNDYTIQASQYDYNNIGQRTKAISITEDGNYTTSYTYDDYGNKASVTDPLNAVTSYTWDYDSSPLWYTLTKTSNNVDVINEDGDLDEDTSITTKVAFEKNTGLKAWSKDGRGYIKGYLYDPIGRLLAVQNNGSTTLPTTLLDPNPETLLTKIEYFDSEFKTKVTDVEKNEVEYVYNKLGQLIDINKGTDTILNTHLDYDNWGNVESVIDPMNSVTKYFYDSLNRNNKVLYPKTKYSIDGNIVNADVMKLLDFDYETNTLVTTDERGAKAYQIFNMYNQVMESGYYPDSNLEDPVSLGKTFYDGSGKPVMQIDGKGNEVVNVFNERGLLDKTILPEETFFEDDTEYNFAPYVRYEYNEKGFKTNVYRSIKDGTVESGTTLHSDVLGRVYQVDLKLTDVDVLSQKVGYDNNGNVLYSFDGKNNLTQMIYNHLNQVELQIDPLDNSTTFEYNDLGNITKMIDPRAPSDPDNPNDPRNSYSATFSIDYSYDEYNRLDYAVLPKSFNKTDRNIIKFKYDDNGNVTNRIEMEGSIEKILSETEFHYNARNMLLQKNQALRIDSSLDNAINQRKFSNNIEYDYAGFQIYIEDETEIKIKTDYDELGRPVLVTHDSGITEKFVWDLNGNQVEFRDGRGLITTTSYNTYNRIDNVTTGLGSEETQIDYKYDMMGNITYFSDGENNISKFKFDKLNRMVEEINSRGDSSNYTYDKVNNLDQKTDYNGSVFDYKYNTNNLLDSVVITNGDVKKELSYDYDEAGSLKYAKDDGVTTKYNYHLIDDIEQYQPDSFNKVSTITTDINGTNKYNVGYEYNEMGQINNIIYPDSREVLSIYNDWGQLQQLGDYTKGSISYKDNGLLNSYKMGNDVVYSSGYDVDNRLSDFSYINQEDEIMTHYNFDYDGSNNIVSKLVNGNSNTYSWDTLNQLKMANNQGDFEVDPDKLDTPLAVGKVLEDYVGEKTLDFTVDDTEIKLDFNSISIGFHIGTGTKLNRFVINPDSIANRLEENKLAIYYSDNNQDWVRLDKSQWNYVEIDGSVELSLLKPLNAAYVKLHCFYDDRNSNGKARKDLATVKNSYNSLLTAYYTVSSMIEQFTYDDAGNRETSDVYYDTVGSESITYIYYENSNLLESDGTYNYIWDNNENLTEKNKVDGTDSTSYSYDLLNRLTEVTLSTGSAPVSYTYDHRGYRIKRIGTDAEDVTYFTFGLNGEILYKASPSQDHYEDYIYLFGKHLAKEVGKSPDDLEKSTRLYYQTDNLGSTIAIMDDTGVKLWDNNYTAFGNSTNESGLLEELGIYTGKEIDPETGLYYFNARWYDPTLGRFITEDPIKDGANWHVYVNNNPINYVDPTGLFILEAAAAAFVAVGSYINTAVTTDAGWNPLEWEGEDWWYWVTLGSGEMTVGYSTDTGGYLNIGDGMVDYNPGEQAKLEQLANNLANSSSYLDMQLDSYSQITRSEKQIDSISELQALIGSGNLGNHFTTLTSAEQLGLLRQLVGYGGTLIGSERGLLAEQMRALRYDMKLEGLFRADGIFMNTTLRDFLNLNKDGTNIYDYNTMKDLGFKIHKGDAFHQTNKRGGRNIKYTHDDGREIVFYGNKSVNLTPEDYGTFNYVNGTLKTSLPGGGHYKYDIVPYFKGVWGW